MTEWAWHVHHEILLEPLRDGGIMERLAYIRACKDPREVPIRERLLQPVRHPERLPPAVVEARQAYDEARQAYVEARQAYDEARQAYVEAQRAYREAMAAHRVAIEALHREECPKCPWDGHTIFPEEE